MEASIDPALKPPTSLPCRLEATLAGGEAIIIDRPITPGSPAMPLSWDEVKDKFRACATGVIDDNEQSAVIDAVARIEKLPSLRPLLASLVPSR
jgi:hypothetical protein